MKFVTLLTSIALLTGCATTTRSTVLGMTVGSAIGGGFGAAAGRAQGTTIRGGAIGAGVGAAIGGVAGYMEHRKPGNGKFQSLLNTKSGGSVPSLTMPEVRRIWVPDRVENDQFIEGHFIYVIDKQSRWRRDDNVRTPTDGR